MSVFSLPVAIIFQVLSTNNLIPYFSNYYGIIRIKNLFLRAFFASAYITFVKHKNPIQRPFFTSGRIPFHTNNFYN